MPGRAAGRIEIDTVEPVEVESGDVGVLHDGVRPEREVIRGDRRRYLIALDRGHLQVERREGEGVPADSAAEVRDAGESGGLESPRMEGCHPQPGRLFEAGFGEEHPLGERTELGHRLRPQFRLAQHRGHEAGCVPGATEFGHRLQHVNARLPRRQGIEQAQPVSGQQFNELGGFHRPTVPILQLALTLQEC